MRLEQLAAACAVLVSGAVRRPQVGHADRVVLDLQAQVGLGDRARRVGDDQHGLALGPGGVASEHRRGGRVEGAAVLEHDAQARLDGRAGPGDAGAVEIVVLVLGRGGTRRRGVRESARARRSGLPGSLPRCSGGPWCGVGAVAALLPGVRGPGRALDEPLGDGGGRLLPHRPRVVLLHAPRGAGRAHEVVVGAHRHRTGGQEVRGALARIVIRSGEQGVAAAADADDDRADGAVVQPAAGAGVEEDRQDHDQRDQRDPEEDLASQRAQDSDRPPGPQADGAQAERRLARGERPAPVQPEQDEAVGHQQRGADADEDLREQRGPVVQDDEDDADEEGDGHQRGDEGVENRGSEPGERAARSTAVEGRRETRGVLRGGARRRRPPGVRRGAGHRHGPIVLGDALAHAGRAGSRGHERLPGDELD